MLDALFFCHAVTNLSLLFSLSSNDDESDVEKPRKKKKEMVDKKEDDDDEDEDEEMEKKLAELKAEELAELKRYIVNMPGLDACWNCIMQSSL